MKDMKFFCMRFIIRVYSNQCVCHNKSSTQFNSLFFVVPSVTCLPSVFSCDEYTKVFHMNTVV